MKKSYAIELDQNEIEWIESTYDCRNDAEVRRILQSFVNEKLPIDAAKMLMRIRKPYTKKEA